MVSNTLNANGCTDSFTSNVNKLVQFISDTGSAAPASLKADQVLDFHSILGNLIVSFVS